MRISGETQAIIDRITGDLRRYESRSAERLIEFHRLSAEVIVLGNPESIARLAEAIEWETEHLAGLRLRIAAITSQIEGWA